MTESVTEFRSGKAGYPGVEGYLHRPGGRGNGGLVLGHGAGSDCNAPLLRAMAEAFAAGGFHVLRANLAFRRMRPKGPPSPATGAADRLGLKHAVLAMRELCPGPIFLGGHSYGGRQASMLAAEEPDLASGLFLLSYPLHPPGKPAQLRTQHFPLLKTPVLFVHGTEDPFGTVLEMREALALISARTSLATVAKAGHSLGGRNTVPLAQAGFHEFFR
jgi:predicted alpha/beta-hydrolase family hydrolase